MGIHAQRELIPAPEEDRLARAALVVLRAISDDAEEEMPRGTWDRVQILPGPDILTDREAAGVLAAVPKPVQCTSEIRGELLVLTVASVEPANEWRLAGLAAVRAEAPVLQQPGRILIVGPAEFISLDLGEFEELERDYLFLARYLVFRGAPVEYGLPNREEPLARSYSPSESRTIRVDAEEADQWPIG